MAEAPTVLPAVAATVPDKVLKLLREILKDGAYCGHSAFLRFAMRFKRRPFCMGG